MAGLDVGSLLETMTAAAAGVLQAKWPAVRSFATTEFQKIAQSIADIGEGVASGQITTDQAPILLDTQKQASLAVIAAAEGMGMIAAEQAVNQAFAAIKGVVNTAIGFPLI